MNHEMNVINLENTKCKQTTVHRIKIYVFQRKHSKTVGNVIRDILGIFWKRKKDICMEYPLIFCKVFNKIY